MTRATPVRRRGSRPRPGALAPTITEPAVDFPGQAAALQIAVQLIGAARSVLIVAHIQPDADALGSALAMGIGLHRRGTPVQVSFAAPDSVPRSLTGLPGQYLLVPAADVQPAELMVTVDVNTRSRLGDLAAMIDSCDRTLVIDHHISNSGFGTDVLIDAAAESTTVLIAAVLDGLGIELDASIAANLYAGLATDSVGFRHASASAHRLAARWLETGIEPDELLRPISDTHPAGWLPMLSHVLGAARLTSVPGSAVAIVSTVITRSAAEGLGPEELDSVIDILRTVQEAGVAVVLKETADDEYQVSLRSRPGIDVAAIAGRLGGGGHVRAAGFGHRGTVDQALAALQLELRG